MSKKIILLAFVALQTFTFLSAQDLRIFADAPSFYAHTTDLQKVKDNVGAGLAVGFNIGTHNLMARLSGGTTAGVRIKDDSNIDFNKINWAPYIRVEAGAGFFRTNGDQCALHNQNAYSLLPKVGAQYHFGDKQMQFLVGLELAYFRIRDMSRNSEFFIDPIYNLTTQKLGLDVGFRTFFNLNAN